MRINIIQSLFSTALLIIPAFLFAQIPQAGQTPQFKLVKSEFVEPAPAVAEVHASNIVGTAGGSRLIPGFKVKAVDTTTAGDTFNGALAVALSESRPLPDAVYYANAAAISVTRLGARPSAPTPPEIDRLRSNSHRG